MEGGIKKLSTTYRTQFFKKTKSHLPKKKKTGKEECNLKAHAYDTYFISPSGLHY